MSVKQQICRKSYYEKINRKMFTVSNVYNGRNTGHVFMNIFDGMITILKYLLMKFSQSKRNHIVKNVIQNNAVQFSLTSCTSF